MTDEIREKVQIEALSRIEDETEEETGILSELTLSCGAVLKLKTVPPLLIQSAASKLKQPVPPVMYIEEKEREEENPMAPSYIAAMEEYEIEVANLTINTLLMMGTELISCPEDFPSPESDDWIEGVEFLLGEGLIPSDKPKVRYLMWLKYVALQANDEIVEISKAVYRRVGVTEEDVSRAIEKFRRD